MRITDVILDAQNSTMERRCAGCNEVLVKRGDEIPAKFRVREYCSRDCYLKTTAKHPPANLSSDTSTSKPCVVCGRIIERGRLRADKWRARRCCSKSCGGKLPKERAEKLRKGGALRIKTWTVAQNHKLARRLAKLPRKDFESVEEAVARGVRITRIETPVDCGAPPIPARGTAGRRRSAS